ncbi:MAG: LUD domain-containing protein, partial [Anaerolineales bacterium]
IPYTTEVETLTAAARRELRRAFLEAPIGISGVNFGVVEDGAVCLVTNEGNGRMVTTLPPVHIALMGAERLVPTLEDLALMLRLLPRAGTGQKLTSYVTLIHGARKANEPDGAEQRHLILLDNGRLRLAQGNQAESLLCIRCGACLNACPVFREIGGHAYQSAYPGPIGSVVSPGLFGTRRFGYLAKASTLCAACMEACPVMIDLPKLLLQARHEFVQQVRQPAALRLGMRLYAWLMADPRRYRRAQQFGAVLTRLLPGRDGWLPAMPPPLEPWTRSRHFPKLASKPFRDRWAQAVDRAVASGPKPAAPKEAKPEPPTPREQVDVATRFIAELLALGAEVIQCSRDQLPEMVAAQLRQRGAERLLTWGPQDDLLQPLLATLRDMGFVLEQPHLARRDPHKRRQALTRLDQAHAGLTGAVAAFADTGTVVLPSGPGRSALASLLPLIHLAVLRKDNLHFSFEDWLASGGKQDLSAASSIALVSGPSRTADIEMTLTIGVHGPGTVIVFLVA